MRSKWKRAPKGWSRGKLAECAYVAITLAALNVHFAAKGNGRTDSPVQIWHRQREKGREERVTSTQRVQISSGRVPPSASSDAWCDVTDPIYAHWNNPIPSIPPPPPPPRRSRGPRRSRRDSPSVIYFHLFRPSKPALISFGLVAPRYEIADLTIYFITAQNNFVSPPSKLLDYYLQRLTRNRSWKIIHNSKWVILELR